MTLEAGWQDYLTTFAEAASAIRATARFADDPDHERRLYRNMMQAQAMAYNLAIVPRVDHPRTFTHTTYQPDFYTLGMACPDFHYVGLFLDGRRTYRATGRRGALVWLSAQVQSHLMGDPRARVVGDFDFADFADLGDGRFDITIGGPEGTPNNIPLDPDSGYNFLWVRRILADWSDDPGDFHICLVDGPAATRRETVDEFGERLAAATHLSRHLLQNWAVGLFQWYDTLAGGRNRIAFLEGARLADKDVGSLAAYYAGCQFKIGPDEALIFEGAPPEGVYWSYQLGDVWSDSLDFIYHQSDINMRRTAIDSDGKYRIILSLEDPGVANWLDPDGNLEGIAMMRTFRSPTRPALPELKVVKLADLQSALPADTKRISPAERRSALAHRETSIRRMYAQ